MVLIQQDQEVRDIEEVIHDHIVVLPHSDGEVVEGQHHQNEVKKLRVLVDLHVGLVLKELCDVDWLCGDETIGYFGY